MIFLTVGTWRNGYDRLVKAVDDLAATGIVREQVIAQVGHGTYAPRHIQVIDFCSQDEFRRLILESNIVVSHAGMGTIAEAIKNGKTIVVLPRRCALGEADSDHQSDTAAQLELEGKILVAHDETELPAKLEQARDFVPAASGTAPELLRTVKEFVDGLAATKADRGQRQTWLARLWPYKILQRDDEGIRTDLRNILEHFARAGCQFDLIVFIPNAGLYLREMFQSISDGSTPVGFVTVRRVSTVSKNGRLKTFVFNRRILSDVLRHVEVLLRLVKSRIGSRQRMVVEFDIDFDPQGKRVLVIDDSVDTGTTMNMVAELLSSRGASSISTACISNHLMPNAIRVDYAVYRYRLLRTRNSRDYHAA